MLFAIINEVGFAVVVEAAPANFSFQRLKMKNKFRTHNCSELTISNLNQEIILSGWIDTIRDHGNLLFIDLRDNYGLTQCVIENKDPNFIGSATNDLNGAIDFSIDGPVIKFSAASNFLRENNNQSGL